MMRLIFYRSLPVLTGPMAATALAGFPTAASWVALGSGVLHAGDEFIIRLSSNLVLSKQGGARPDLITRKSS